MIRERTLQQQIVERMVIRESDESSSSSSGSESSEDNQQGVSNKNPRTSHKLLQPNLPNNRPIPVLKDEYKRYLYPCATNCGRKFWTQKKRNSHEDRCFDRLEKKEKNELYPCAANCGRKFWTQKKRDSHEDRCFDRLEKKEKNELEQKELEKKKKEKKELEKKKDDKNPRAEDCEDRSDCEERADRSDCEERSDRSENDTQRMIPDNMTPVRNLFSLLLQSLFSLRLRTRVTNRFPVSQRRGRKCGRTKGNT
jgi:hypothetical protein